MKYKIIFFILLFCNCKSKNPSPLLAALSNGKEPLQIKEYDQKRQRLKSENCKDCHKTIYADWEKSSHSKAFTNKIFYYAFLNESQGWCFNCHSPLWQKKENTYRDSYFYHEEKEEVMAEGVNCAVCHLRKDIIYTSKKPSPNSINCLYPVKKDETLGKTKFCANCHQFNFPKEHSPKIKYGDIPMQNVVNEFKETIWFKNGESCQSCHYKFGKHSRSISHNREEFQKNLNIHFEYIEDKDGEERYLKAFLFFDKIGHNFPTGDLFRILEIRAMDSNKNLLGTYLLQKSVRVADKKLLVDSTLKPKSYEKGASREIWIPVTKKPELCEVNYHYQGKIENHLRTYLNYEELVFTIFKGRCY